MPYGASYTESIPSVRSKRLPLKYYRVWICMLLACVPQWLLPPANRWGAGLACSPMTQDCRCPRHTCCPETTETRRERASSEREIVVPRDAVPHVRVSHDRMKHRTITGTENKAVRLL